MRVIDRFSGISNVVSATYQITYALKCVMPQMVDNGMALYRIGTNMVLYGHIMSVVSAYILQCMIKHY